MRNPCLYVGPLAQVRPHFVLEHPCLTPPGGSITMIARHTCWLPCGRAVCSTARRAAGHFVISRCQYVGVDTAAPSNAWHMLQLAMLMFLVNLQRTPGMILFVGPDFRQVALILCETRLPHAAIKLANYSPLFRTSVT